MISKIIYLLTAIVAYLERLGEERRQKEAQKAREELDEDYRAWYDAHFCGVPDEPDDAKQTDKADSDPR